MKIALYHPWLKSRGGIEKMVLEYAKRSEHEVTVFTLYYAEPDTFEGFADVEVQVVGDNKPPQGLLDKTLRFGLGTLKTELPLNGYDALLVSEAGLGSLITIKNHDLPVLCYCHTPLRAALPEFKETYTDEINPVLRPAFSLLTFKYSLLERWAWKHFDRVVCNSENTRERVEEKGLAAREDMVVIHPGVDMDDFTPGDFDHYFLYPSRFRSYKRQHLAIEAFNSIKDSLPDDFRLVLAGSAQENEYITRLQGMDTDRVEFRFDVSDEEWHTLYEDAYTVLFLAENEDWGIVPIEAMAAGKPIIAVEEGGAMESVRDDENGLLVPARADAIAAAMQELVEHEDRARDLGAGGRGMADRYTWDAFVEKLDGEVDAL